MRARRKSLGLTQQQVGDKLGLTFQQVQKYERAANRVSASMLFDIAEALETPITFFFDEFRRPAGESTRKIKKAKDRAFTAADEAELVAIFPIIGNPQQKRIVLELVRSLVDSDD